MYTLRSFCLVMLANNYSITIETYYEYLVIVCQSSSKTNTFLILYNVFFQKPFVEFSTSCKLFFLGCLDHLVDSIPVKYRIVYVFIDASTLNCTFRHFHEIFILGNSAKIYLQS